MLARIGLEAQEALVCTMVLVAATGGGISDREIGVMSGLVQTLPAFRDFSTERLRAATDAAVGLPDEADGLAQQEGLRMLEFIRHELHLDPLITAAIERGARARHQQI